jgi:YhcH/YjgK/YiaL family protein
MIIDTLKNASLYYQAHPLFKAAFEYISSIDLPGIADGNYEIDGENLRSIVSNKKGKTAEESLAKFECHDKQIDIQLCVSGNETIGWKPREKCVKPNGTYNTDKDVSFFNDAPDTFFNLTNHQFAIFFPNDVHAPMIGDTEIKKLVIKVKL